MSNWKTPFAKGMEKIDPRAAPEISSAISRKNEGINIDSFGKILSVTENKILKILTILGAPGIVYACYIMYTKEYIGKGKREYIYDEISRSKAEKMASFAIVLTIMYVFIFFYLINA